MIAGRQLKFIGVLLIAFRTNSGVVVAWRSEKKQQQQNEKQASNDERNSRNERKIIGLYLGEHR